MTMLLKQPKRLGKTFTRYFKENGFFLEKEEIIKLNNKTYKEDHSPKVTGKIPDEKELDVTKAIIEKVKITDRPAFNRSS